MRTNFLIYYSLFLISYFSLLVSCKQTQRSPIEIIRVDEDFLDSIRNNNDTGYTRMIGAGEFNIAEQYIRKHDSLISKIMKDTAGNVVAVVQFQKGKRNFYAEYYTNSQLKASLPLNKNGAFDGYAKYYYEDGRVKSEGFYTNGLFSGQWKNYNAVGRLVSIDEYDRNGQVIKTTFE